MPQSHVATILVLMLFSAILGCSDDQESTCENGIFVTEDQDAFVGQTIVMSYARQLEDGSQANSLCSITEKDVAWEFESVPVSSALTDDDIIKTTGREATFACDTDGDFVVNVSGMAADSEVITSSFTVGCAYAAQPIADCGPDWVGLVNTSAGFDGSGSVVQEGATIRYSWTLASVPLGSDLTTANIVGADSATPVLIPDVIGTYTLGLSVRGGTQSDNCLATAEASLR